jgi:hypothetical protein
MFAHTADMFNQDTEHPKDKNVYVHVPSAVDLEVYGR